MQNINLKPLIGLGFNNLEAQIYTYLLQNSPATGYRIAKGLAKPASNIYKAIETLHKKGAIIIDDDTTRLCRAIPVDELIDSLQRKFDNLKNQAKAELNRLKISQSDNRIYQLQSTDQVISRFQKMLSECQRVAIMDLFPFAVEILHKDIIAAIERGVRVIMKLYRPREIPGATIFLQCDGESVIERWPGQWANGIIDGEEYLLSFLTKDAKDVHQAVWSNNYCLSWIYYDGLANEFLVTALRNGFENNQSVDELKNKFNKYESMLKLDATGFKGATSFFLALSGETEKEKE
ncbi:MAG: helix-turn-helix domain-containing protein [Candidatus Zixiibacteriota bacterium]